MHEYLRAIGFSDLNKRSELKKILESVLQEPTEKQYVSLSDDSIAVEYRKEFLDSIGITVCGEYSDDVEFEYEYYYPYFKSLSLSSSEDISIERRIDKDSFEGVCDDFRVGMSIIFYLNNRMDYMKRMNDPNFSWSNLSVNLSGLSIEGNIVLPLQKDPQEEYILKENEKNRSELLAAAMDGDEDAMENLTLDDIDTYAAISEKIHETDIFTIVDTYFMPYGIECDVYSIMGEIIEYRDITNKLTKEEICIIVLSCNDLILEVCINKKDLVGEPAPHRRFKGIIWLQGLINFAG
ncbi:MAG: DUF3881 family protein [Lachnospiraceae bacterium]|nr:DUF3881 family protein [Lachnospiraceae bacterium]